QQKATDADGIAHFQTLLEQPGTWHLWVTVSDADGDSVAGYEDIKVVNRKHAEFTDLNGKGWTTRNDHYVKPVAATARAARAGGPLVPLSKAEKDNYNSILGELNQMASGMLSLFGGCHDLQCAAARFQGTPTQQQQALDTFNTIVIQIQSAAKA